MHPERGRHELVELRVEVIGSTRGLAESQAAYGAVCDGQVYTPAFGEHGNEGKSIFSDMGQCPILRDPQRIWGSCPLNQQTVSLCPGRGAVHTWHSEGKGASVVPVPDTCKG